MNCADIAQALTVIRRLCGMVFLTVCIGDTHLRSCVFLRALDLARHEQFGTAFRLLHAVSIVSAVIVEV